jgi:hypothetical protein
LLVESTFSTTSTTSTSSGTTTTRIETIRYRSTAPTEITINLQPSRHYAIVAGGVAAFRGIGVTPEAIGYSIFDFTDNDVKVIWTNNPTVAEQSIKDNNIFFRNMRKHIERSMK